LFNKLRQQGYRIVGFDYLGQGGSEGSLNNSSVGDITQAAQMVWDYYAKTKDPVFHRSCADSKKRVIGWSLGGLVGYYLAQLKWSDTSVLINPLLAPKDPAGESEGTRFPWFASSEVSHRTLTRNKFDRYTDPHLDPIKPKSYKDAWLFIQDMKIAAAGARNGRIDGTKQRILFLFSDLFDKYADNQESRRVIEANVKPFFRTQSFAEAFHELDNELPEVSEPVHQYTIDFFDEF
jgi:alpha-beta hydrolase superfamily lysophospholipase